MVTIFLVTLYISTLSLFNIGETIIYLHRWTGRPKLLQIVQKFGFVIELLDGAYPILSSDQGPSFGSDFISTRLACLC